MQTQETETTEEIAERRDNQRAALKQRIQDGEPTPSDREEYRLLNEQLSVAHSASTGEKA